MLDIKSNQVAGVDVSRYDYGVNDIGQRVTIGRSGSEFTAVATETAGYNARGEMVYTTISNQQDRNRIYNFDGIGNRTKATEGTIETSYFSNAVNEYAIISGTAHLHDDDGNLTDNGTLTFKWDAENRLLSATDKTSSNVLIDYKYDYQSRRIERNNSEGKTNWIYHGWNPCGQYLGGTLDRTYTWGTDLSGSEQGAGGVGGLLAVTNRNSGNRYYPTFDGKGDISVYINEQQETVAHYEYETFGNTIASTGIIGDYFEHRFSTKSIDEETGLYFYGYRYYDPVTGRWPSRDPIAEQGGMNLYGFVGNEPYLRIDYLGLRDLSESEDWQYSGGFRYRSWGGAGGEEQRRRLSGGRSQNSMTPMNFNYRNSLFVNGCLNAVGPVVVCLSGNISTKIGKCCNRAEKTEETMFEVSGSITASIGVGTSGITVTYSKAIDTDFGMPDCPSEIEPKVSGIFRIFGTVSVGVASARGLCDYNFKRKKWNCSLGAGVTGQPGASAPAPVGGSFTVGGGVSFSGRFQ